MTPPEAPMWVRVPPGSAVEFADKLAALEPAERAAGKRVESKKGESMASIAKRNGLKVRQLAWFNRKVERLKSGNLRAGQAIFVPALATVAAALDVPDPSIERYPRRARAAKGKMGAMASKAKTAAATMAKARGR